MRLERVNVPSWAMGKDECRNSEPEGVPNARRVRKGRECFGRELVAPQGVPTPHTESLRAGPLP